MDDPSLNLSRAYEEQLLAPSSSRPLRCVLVTGYLGAGKTSLLRHLLRERRNLRFAVLQNEFGEADVDSGTLGSASANAVYGLPSLSLPDGCACCYGLAALRNTVRALLASPAGVQVLLIETTGLADPAPVAAALLDVGVHLDCVAAVVDAESVVAQLQTSGTAAAQVASADVVLINKCDCASLGAAADAEDAVRRLTLARTLRCSHGCVPLSAVLDVREAAVRSSASAFLSHEDVPATAELELGDAPVTARALAAPQASHPLELEKVTSVTWRRSAPLCAAALLACLAQHALPARGLLRAKGHLWLAQRPLHRCALQLAGARRTVVSEEAAWEGPPASCLVLIGTHRGALLALRDILDALPEAGGCDQTAAAFAARVAADGRFCQPELLPGGVAELSLRGAPRQGLDGPALNGMLARAVNVGGALLLWTVAAREPASALRLRVALGAGDDGAALADVLLRCTDAVYRKALGTASACDC